MSSTEYNTVFPKNLLAQVGLKLVKIVVGTAQKSDGNMLMQINVAIMRGQIQFQLMSYVETTPARVYRDRPVFPFSFSVSIIIGYFL